MLFHQMSKLILTTGCTQPTLLMIFFCIIGTYTLHFLSILLEVLGLLVLIKSFVCSRVINDRRVKIRLMDEAGFVVPPSPISDFKSKSFDLIRSTVNKNFGFGTVPGVMVGNTDTRWYWDLSKQIYRFSPVELTIQETKMFHGVNEKISAKALTSMIDFYKDLVMMDLDEDATDKVN